MARKPAQHRRAAPQRSPRRKAASSRALPFSHAPHEAVRPILNAATRLNEFLATVVALTPEERGLIVEQAIVLLDGFYAHLPLKRAMHAIDPLQRLRLLRHRLAQFVTETSFHAEMTDIFTSLRDLHTNYLLPAPYNGVAAALPFAVEAYWEKDVRRYIVGHVMDGFSHPTFRAGVEVRYWNGVPIERAVEIAATRHAGSNPEARHSRGVAGLTARSLNVSPPPDEEWVIVGYRTADGRDHELRVNWIITGLPQETTVDAAAPTISATALGLDLETDAVRRINKLLFAPEVVAASARMAAIAGDPSAVFTPAGTDSTMPDVFRAKAIDTSHGKFGYIRIWTFQVQDADTFVAEFVRLVGLLPQNGLIVDVRDNGGGLIYAGEQLLQVLTPNRIEPQRLQFINTPLNLRLCQLHPDDLGLRPWIPSIERSVETGAPFSLAYPISSAEKCNALGQRYHGPVLLVTSARCYSTTDFFAAGFQDHAIGPILGVDRNTGAGGANVWTHALLSRFFAASDSPPSPFQDLPNGAGMRVAIRRSLRVGARAGTEVEDLGVTPDVFHKVTRDDLLNANVDLLEAAAAILATMPVYVLEAAVVSNADGRLTLDVETRNLDRLDVFADGRPQYSQEISDGKSRVSFAAAVTAGSTIELQCYGKGQLAAARRLTL